LPIENLSPLPQPSQPEKVPLMPPPHRISTNFLALVPRFVMMSLSLPARVALPVTSTKSDESSVTVAS
jgi:hypothetical protein